MRRKCLFSNSIDTVKMGKSILVTLCLATLLKLTIACENYSDVVDAAAGGVQAMIFEPDTIGVGDLTPNDIPGLMEQLKGKGPKELESEVETFRKAVGAFLISADDLETFFYEKVPHHVSTTEHHKIYDYVNFNREKLVDKNGSAVKACAAMDSFKKVIVNMWTTVNACMKTLLKMAVPEHILTGAFYQELRETVKEILDAKKDNVEDVRSQMEKHKKYMADVMDGKHLKDKEQEIQEHDAEVEDCVETAGSDLDAKLTIILQQIQKIQA